jgi:hypothetical protein
MDYDSAETVIVIKDLLRKYPERYEEVHCPVLTAGSSWSCMTVLCVVLKVIPALQKCLKTIEEEEGKVAVLWCIGEYGESIKVLWTPNHTHASSICTFLFLSYAGCALHIGTVDWCIQWWTKQRRTNGTALCLVVAASSFAVAVAA